MKRCHSRRLAALALMPSLILAASAADCTGKDKRPPSDSARVRDDTAQLGVLESERPPQDGDLTKPLRDYSPTEFLAQFKPTTEGGRTSYGQPSVSLPRWCGGNFDRCDYRATATIRTLSLDLAQVPDDGVVVAMYEPVRRRNSREIRYGMRADTDVLRYFLVVTPGAQGQPPRWRFVGIVRRPTGTIAFDDGITATGTFLACEGSATHDTAFAGFEPCTTKRDLHALASSRGVSFGQVLQEYRTTMRSRLQTLALPADSVKLFGIIGGPLDEAWTTCLAGCCRATFN